MIIGLTGSNCSGKDTIADILIKKLNFKHLSLSDIIREQMKFAGIEITRENLIAFGTKLRETHGNGILAKKALEKINTENNFCITSIRHPDEISEFRIRKSGNFILINIDAKQSIRFKRMQKRHRPGDPETLEKFIELEKRESQMEGSGQQLSKTAQATDIVFENNYDNFISLEKDFFEFFKKIQPVDNKQRRNI
jgi:dephospho-CoA kinase